MNGRIASKAAIIAGTEEFLFYPQRAELPYRIMIATPKQPAPPEGYPVIYVLDANAFFQTFQETIRVQSGRAEKTGVIPAVIVGIGYPSQENFVTDRRFYDFTPPADSVTLPVRPRGGEWPRNGGADLFLDFIEAELKPYVEKHFSIDKNRQTLFGHSLGGLFALYTLFTRTAAFQNYIAGSPSIWWNNQAILAEEEAFTAKLGQLDAYPKVLLAVGSLEKDYMVSDAEELFQRLLRVCGERLPLEFIKAEGENHISVVPTILSRALRFINEQ
ncbi:MAG: alpha/beta hydrolase [Bacillus sp. (in: firmicutes)]